MWGVDKTAYAYTFTGTITYSYHIPLDFHNYLTTRGSLDAYDRSGPFPLKVQIPVFPVSRTGLKKFADSTASTTS